MRVFRGPGDKVHGLLIYVSDEYAFKFLPDSPVDLAKTVGDGGVTSISIGTLQIEVAVETGRALFVWGLNPRLRWVEAQLRHPQYETAAVFFETPRSLETGVSISIAPVGSWQTRYDPITRWVRVSEGDEGEDWFIEIADGVILGAVGDQLASIWLKPSIE